MEEGQYLQELKEGKKLVLKSRSVTKNLFSVWSSCGEFDPSKRPDAKELADLLRQERGSIIGKHVSEVMSYRMSKKGVPRDEYSDDSDPAAGGKAGPAMNAIGPHPKVIVDTTAASTSMAPRAEKQMLFVVPMTQEEKEKEKLSKRIQGFLEYIS